MSSYSPVFFLDPITNKEELNEKLSKKDQRLHNPLKAPTTDVSISPLFYDPIVLKFTNVMMKGGNKERVREVKRRLFENMKNLQIEKWHKASEIDRSQIECNPVTIFKQAVDNCKPVLITVRVVKGGVAYRVPVCAKENERQFRAMKWIIDSCRDKERRIPMEEKLTLKIMDAYSNQGKAVRKKQELHKICESNRAYARLRYI
ncbi:small ribosomal subunit protein uS7m-like [Physella acuta]|uniref:small ribosomal subunit protein uS7m-like n=1 Tax=Physella acuta TaxID=109671 RepID=UPI0027DBB7DA|nr:small ribosomal subunit protein uS7m-like [Physella acuta]